MALDFLLVDQEEHTECLLGNEAIVRGALEAGVYFASGYPGTPSSEVTDSFARIAEAHGIVFEYSINEKIALEMTFAASISGARSICAMKHLGLMYAGDPLSTIPYVGAVGGMVVVSAGDPSCRTSPNEQDQRHLAPMLHLPMLDPSSPQEAHAMARFAFELSEKSQLPVIMRPTTRVCHSRAVITYDSLRKPQRGTFKRDPQRLVPVPVNARRLRLDLKKRIEIARELLETSQFFRVSGSSETAIIASGAPAATTADWIREKGLSDDLMLVTLGSIYPLPERRLVEVLQGVKRVLVVEELSPFLENAVGSLVSQHHLQVEILGKHTEHFPEEFEYDPDLIGKAISDAFELGPRPKKTTIEYPQVPPRPPSLCPGCPHRSAQFAARTVFGEESLFFNDIGCYTLGYGPPLNTADALLCMGAGFTLAAGVSRTTGERTVGILGDSTFFHSGMPALLNAIKEDVNMVAVILDNHVTAMTGFQESPTIEVVGGEISRHTSIPEVVRALGAKHVEVVDPYDLPETIAAFERAKRGRGVSVVITERACPAFVSRETHSPYKQGTYAVEHEDCQTCGREAVGLRCSECVSEGHLHQMARSRARETCSAESCALPASAPCSTQCPVGLCIQGYVGHIAAGQYREAYNKIVSQLPLPDSVCRVCHRPCEEVCVRQSIDEPVAVNDLKRFVMDWAAKEAIPYEPERAPDCGRKAAVVGAGPSGLAAAWSLALRGYTVTLYDDGDEPGGLLRSGIPEYRLPREALERDIGRLLGLGITFVGNRALGRNLRLRDLVEEADAVFLGVGAQDGITLSLEAARDEQPIVQDALSYLKAVNANKPVTTEKRVVVVGGGNSALDAARTARRLGAERVVIAYRRTREEMPGLVDEVQATEDEGVQLQTQLQPVAIERGGLRCVATEQGEVDDSGRSRPVPVPGSERLVAADQILAAIGQRPDASFLESDILLERTKDGSLVVDADGRTSHPKVFAGGDVVPGPRTVTEAIQAGLRAAYAIDRNLFGQERADRRPPPPLVDPSETVGRPGAQRADRTPRQRPREVGSIDRLDSFTEVVQTFAEEAAQAEAERCMVCGHCGNCRVCLDVFGCPAFCVKDGSIIIDPNLCMGCGVCADLCPNNAIHKTEELETIKKEEQTSEALSRRPHATEKRAVPERLKVLVVGVGGQGALTAARLIGEAALAAKQPVSVGTMHGMSQRGGSVECSVLIGPGEGSAIGNDQAHIVLGLEPLEVVRALPTMSERTKVVVNLGKIVPFTLASRGMSYPPVPEILQQIEQVSPELYAVDGPRLVEQVGISRTLNVVMLGALAGLGMLPFDVSYLWSAIEKAIPERYLDPNRRAFELGVQVVEGA